MKRYLLLALPLLLLGCGGGGGDKGTTPIRMNGSVYFDSKSAPFAKVGLVVLDTNDNWTTAARSQQISNGASGWGSGNYQVNLPVLGKDASYAIIVFNDKNGNGNYDEIDDELVSTTIQYYADYYVYPKEWRLYDYSNHFYGYIPGTKVILDTSPSYASSAEGLKQTAIGDIKEQYKEFLAKPRTKK